MTRMISLRLTFMAALLGVGLLAGCSSQKTIQSAPGSSLQEDTQGPTAPLAHHVGRSHAQPLQEVSDEQARLIQDELLALPEGLFTFDTPPALRKGMVSRLEARVSKDFPVKLTEAIQKNPKLRGITVKNFVGLQLAGTDFDLKSDSPEEQPVGDQSFTVWAWDVKSDVLGKRPLALTMTLRLANSLGEKKHVYPVLERSIDVQEVPGGFFKTYGWWILAILLVAAAVALLLKKN